MSLQIAAVGQDCLRLGRRVLGPFAPTCLHTSRAVSSRPLRGLLHCPVRKFTDWPRVLASCPCTVPWGLGKCAWNKPPGPWWSWPASPTPPPPWLHFPGLTLEVQAISGVGRKAGFGAPLSPAAAPHPQASLSAQCLLRESLSQETTSGGLGLGRTVSGGEGSDWHPLFLLPLGSPPFHSPLSPSLTVPRSTSLALQALACLGSSLTPEAAKDTLYILTQGVM